MIIELSILVGTAALLYMARSKKVDYDHSFVSYRTIR